MYLTSVFTRHAVTLIGVAAGYLLLTDVYAPRAVAQDDPMRFRVDVVLVQLNVAVTDDKGNYITGLRPEDFVITEDKIPQKISTFEESAEVHKGMMESTGGSEPKDPVKAAATDLEAGVSGAAASRISDSVFILFDTSNYMYRSFVFAQDAIADFVRSMDGYGKIAFYSYSRNLLRATTLTSDRFRLENGVRSTVAGDDAALYNSLLLTVQDAAPLRGRKAIVVFSNGPDNASAVPPEDVAELAQSTGTLIYIISTRQAQEDPASAAAFERMSKVSGGKAYFAKNWRDEKNAFDSIREDLAHLYTLSYYPQANPNRGWRSISVKLVGKNLQKYHIRSRDGYRLLPPNSKAAQMSSEAKDDSESK